MIILVVCLMLLSFSIIVSIFKKDIDIAGICTMALAALFLTGNFISSIIYSSMYDNPNRIENTWSCNISSFKGNSKTGFYLGCETDTDGWHRYITFLKKNDGKNEYYERYGFLTNVCRIVETDDTVPRIVKDSTENRVPLKVSVFNMSDNSELYTFYVPKGTIIESFGSK